MSAAQARGFDRLAPGYRALEFAAFGRDLERARFAYASQLRGRERVLLLGDGDGRFACRVAALAPRARITSVDSSPGMLAVAARRLAQAGLADRVTLQCADARTLKPECGRYDAVATLFFLDCFDADGVAGIVSKVGRALPPGSPWLFADFVIPKGTLKRLRARAWIALLYRFFRAETGITATALPPSELILEGAGWRCAAKKDFNGGMIRSAIYCSSGGIW